MLKKNLSVMWAFTANGIMLHNVDTNAILELNRVQERIWAYIDGTHSPDEILFFIKKESLPLPFGPIDKIVDKTIKTLLSEGFILE